MKAVFYVIPDKIVWNNESMAQRATSPFEKYSDAVDAAKGYAIQCPEVVFNVLTLDSQVSMAPIVKQVEV